MNKPTNNAYVADHSFSDKTFYKKKLQFTYIALHALDLYSFLCNKSK